MEWNYPLRETAGRQAEPSKDSIVNQTSPGFISSPDDQGIPSPYKVTCNDGVVGEGGGLQGIWAKLRLRIMLARSNIPPWHHSTLRAISSLFVHTSPGGRFVLAAWHEPYLPPTSIHYPFNRLHIYEFLLSLSLALFPTRLCFTAVIFSSLSFKATGDPMSAQRS